MYESFINASASCNIPNSTASINAAILYKDDMGEYYHYLFKNISSKNKNYIIMTKCRIREDTKNTVGDHIKVEPKYPTIVNKLNWGGLYFTDKYEKPTKISTMFVVKKKYVFQYLNKEISDEEVIIAIQDKTVIFLNKKERLVDKPIPLDKIWLNVNNIDAGIMIHVKGVPKLYLFSGERYYKIKKPFFGTYNNGNLTPLSVDNMVSLYKSVIWNFDMGTNCKQINAIVPIYEINNNYKIKYYIFQNNSYLRYNITKSKVDIIISDITISAYYLIYAKLLHDLVGTKQEVSEDELINNTISIDKNIYNIEPIISGLCKRKVKLYKKTKKSSHLVLILDKTIGIKEQIIFQYSNTIDSYNDIKITKNKDARCDIQYENNCINFYNCGINKCKNMNIETTFTYKDSKDIRLDISNNFKIDRILYIETYPQSIDENFKSLWRGIGSENQSIQKILSNIDSGSTNLGIDAITYIDDSFIFYKNYVDPDGNSSIKYIDGTIKNDVINISDKYNKSSVKLESINLLLENEKSTIENNYGSMSEIESICIATSGLYYIFGKILHSDISRVILYDLKKKTQSSKYAEDVSKKFKNIGSFYNVNTVFNLDPYNNMKNSEDTLCFNLNTVDNPVKLITTNSFLNNCRNVSGNLCIDPSIENTNANKNKYILQAINLYFNYTHILRHKEINAVTYTGTELYVFRKTVCDIYKGMENENHDGEYKQIKTLDNTISKYFNIKIKSICEPEPTQVNDVDVYVPKIDMILPTKVTEEKKESISFIYIVILLLIIMSIIGIVYNYKLKNINKR